MRRAPTVLGVRAFREERCRVLNEAARLSVAHLERHPEAEPTAEQLVRALSLQVDPVALGMRLNLLPEIVAIDRGIRAPKRYQHRNWATLTPSPRSAARSPAVSS